MPQYKYWLLIKMPSGKGRYGSKNLKPKKGRKAKYMKRKKK